RYFCDAAVLVQDTRWLPLACASRTNPGSIAHPHIASRRILDRGENAAARLPGGDLGRILRLEPFGPVRPPRPRMLLGLAQPSLEIGAGRLGAGPVLIFHLVGRSDRGGNMPGTRQDEAE